MKVRALLSRSAALTGDCAHADTSVRLGEQHAALLALDAVMTPAENRMYSSEAQAGLNRIPNASWHPLDTSGIDVLFLTNVNWMCMSILEMCCCVVQPC